MKNIKVELVITPNIEPRSFIGGLAKLTQLKEEFSLVNKERGTRVINSIKTMGHTTLLEPLSFGFIITGASRVFLGQIRTHRMASFVSQSHQYQNQTGYPFVTLPELSGELLEEYNEFMATADKLYTKLCDSGIDQDQARYVIPPAARNDLYFGANARQLLEVIIPLRSCRRNTYETRLVISHMLAALKKTDFWFIFENAGPACLTTGKCDQGKMNCGEPFTSFNELINV